MASFKTKHRYPFVRTLEQNWKEILEELETVLYNEVENEKTYFTPWHEKEIYNGTWDVFGFYSKGEKLTFNCNLCPKTTQTIETIPGLVTAGFSSLGQETHILPHVGYTDEVLRCHLGLIVPDKAEYRYSWKNKVPIISCGLRVGEEIYRWKAGEAFVFDDTQEHEAWNYGNRTRFVLLIDFKKS